MVGRGTHTSRPEGIENFPRGLRRLRNNWTQEWKLGRYWRLEIEWVYLGRYFAFTVRDSRREDD